MEVVFGGGGSVFCLTEGGVSSVDKTTASAFHRFTKPQMSSRGTNPTSS